MYFSDLLIHVKTCHQQPQLKIDQEKKKIDSIIHFQQKEMIK